MTDLVHWRRNHVARCITIQLDGSLLIMKKKKKRQSEEKEKEKKSNSYCSYEGFWLLGSRDGPFISHIDALLIVEGGRCRFIRIREELWRLFKHLLCRRDSKLNELNLWFDFRRNLAATSKYQNEKYKTSENTMRLLPS